MRPRTLSFALVAVGLAGLIATIAIFATSMSGPSMGTWGPFGRGPGCAAPHLAGQTVEVTLTDMGMMGGGTVGEWNMMNVTASPSAVSAGQVSFVARNKGMMVHELVVLPLPTGGAGTRPIDANGRMSEADSLGEASRSCGDGAGEGLAPGSTGWVTLHLAPGRYELVCDEPGHYVMGMFTELDVHT